MINEQRDTVKFILESMRKFTLLVGDVHTGMIGDRRIQHSWEFHLGNEPFYYYPFPGAEKSHSRQAEFCSELIRHSISTIDTQSIIVLTNSDFFVDRARIEIAQGLIAPEDVALLYFEWRDDGQLTRHKIEIDELGNILNAPTNYRSFEMAEQMALLAAELTEKGESDES